MTDLHQIIKHLISDELNVSSKQVDEGLFDNFMDYLAKTGKDAREKEAMKQISKKDPKKAKAYSDLQKKLSKNKSTMTDEEADDFYKKFLQKYKK